MDQGSTMKRSAVHNFAPTVTKFCVMWEGQALPHDTKFGNSRCEIIGRRVIFIWSLIHGLRWSGLIKAEPGYSWLLIRGVFRLHKPDDLIVFVYSFRAVAIPSAQSSGKWYNDQRSKQGDIPWQHFPHYWPSVRKDHGPLSKCEAFVCVNNLLIENRSVSHSRASYPTIHHFGTEVCTFLFQSGVLWDIGQVHCGICDTGQLEAHICIHQLVTRVNIGPRLQVMAYHLN